MKQETYQVASRLFNVLSHPARLQILDELRKDEACVCHLQAALGRPQAYVSQQLRVLRDASIVTAERQGALVHYHLSDELTKHLLEEVLGPASQRVAIEGCRCPRCQTHFGH